MDILAALQSHGLIIDKLDLSDGIHRCGTIKHPRSSNGWYIPFEGGKAIKYGNWELGSDELWKDDKSEFDNSKFTAYTKAIKEAQEKVYQEKAIQALEYIESLKKDGFSEYLKRKRIFPNGALFDSGCIVIPCQDANGKIWSYQKIYNNGDKRFMAEGKIKDCYHLITSRNINKDEVVIVCEGFATGASIHQKTGFPVFVAFNAGNLKRVCDALGFRNIIIAADNDESGIGEKKAKESGYKYVMPSRIGWDFSDVFLNDGDISSYFIPKAAKGSLAPHGLVGEIADWITSTAIHPQPKLSIAAALAFVGLLKGHKYQTSTGLRSNLLVLSLAPSASGKEHPQNCIMRLMDACGLQQHLLAEPTSGSGFLTGLTNANRLGLLVMDEIGRYLGNAMSKDSKSWQKEVIDYIIKSFSKADSILIGKQYANNKANPRIDIKNPHFCCIGSTVKEKMIEACKSTEVIDGFLNRWILFNVEDRPKEQYENYSSVIPESLINSIKSLIPIERDNYGNEILHKTSYSPEAADIMRAFRAKIQKKIEESEYPFDALYGRSSTHAAKIAMIVADGDLIVCSDVNFAINVVEQSNEAILKFAGLISDNQFEADYIRVREIIAKHKVITKNTLSRKTQFITGGARRRDEIVTSLLGSNIICEETTGKETCYKFIF